MGREAYRASLAISLAASDRSQPKKIDITSHRGSPDILEKSALLNDTRMVTYGATVLAPNIQIYAQPDDAFVTHIYAILVHFANSENAKKELERMVRDTIKYLLTDYRTFS